ncbi:hypothetical protein JB92DRAFT_2890419 [Gautieria morchelliformis]|nr:hypothetical protein JB92DRAFT_2890419 [Gautieria morchelliformis]
MVWASSSLPYSQSPRYPSLLRIMVSLQLPDAQTSQRDAGVGFLLRLFGTLGKLSGVFLAILGGVTAFQFTSVAVHISCFQKF